MFDRKTVIAFILIFIIFIAWSYWMQSQAPPPKPPSPTAADTLFYDDTTSRAVGAPTQEMTGFTERPSADTLMAPVDTVQEVFISVETDKYIARLTNRGAGLIELQMKDYSHTDNGLVSLLPRDASPTPTILGRAERFSDHLLVYRTDAHDILLSGSSSPQSIRFTTTVPGAGAITKEYTFYPDRYNFDLRLEIEGAQQMGLDRDYILAWLPGIPASEKNLIDDFSNYKGGAHLAGEMYKIDDFTNNLMNVDLTGSAQFVGSRSKYFAYAFIPQGALSIGAYFRGEKRQRVGVDGNYEEKVISAGIIMPTAGSSRLDNTFRVFAGPLDYHLLKKYEADLEDFLDWGWKIIRPFSLAVYWLSYELHRFIPNYGIVIILVAILLKVITFPLTRKSLKSMAAMKRLAPKMEEIKAKYKNDAQKMNQEVMKLYKKEGVNPLGGCLLLLPQMPLLFGLYQTFRSTIEFRQASFVPPWTDLSQPDPFPYIMVFLMAGATFFQQKMSMTDPKMKMVMYIMPVVLFFVMRGLPVGLVLYWTSYSILSVVEALVIKRPDADLNPQVK